MSLEECYAALCGDYANAKVRLMSERLIDKFIRKFPVDPSMQQLNDAIALGDRKAAFIAVHTLKGVAANLSFTELQAAASQLTEQLRDGSNEPDASLCAHLREAYNKVISALQLYMGEA